MGYAILQKDLVAPALEQLKRAYRSSPTLRDIDAQTSLNDAYGVLLKGLEQADAQTLRDALWREGVPTEVVPDGTLPPIPQAHTLSGVAFDPLHLEAEDPLHRRIAIPWDNILIIAAGAVRAREIKRVKTTAPEPIYRASGISYDTVDDVRTKEEETFHLMADICLVGGLQRFSLLAENFDFSYLGTRRSENVLANLAYFIQDLAQFAPNAGLNRGAFLLSQNGPEPFVYPSKAAYFEELTWMLWRSSGTAQSE